MAITEQLQNLAAKINHEVNLCLNRFYGQEARPAWDKLTEDERHAAFISVQNIIDNPDMTPAESHAKWMEVRLAEGWRYGEVKDPVKKTHPDLVSYSELPDAEKLKDHLFIAIVKACM